MLVPEGLIHNVALLLAAAVLFDVATLRWRATPNLVRQFVTGIVLGGICMAVMLSPWEFTPGVVFDTRSVLIAIAGLFFGTVPAVVTMVMAAALRAWQGGAGAPTGIGVILASGLIGLGWRHFRRERLARLGFVELYGLGWAVHIVMLLLMLTLPWAVALRVLKGIAFPVLLLYPLGTALLGSLMAGRLRREQEAASAREHQEALKNILNTAPQAIFWKDAEGRYLGCNRVFAEAAGFDSPDQIIGKTDFDLPWTKTYAEAYRADDREVIRANAPKLHIREPMVRADGVEIYLDTSKVPLRDEEGVPFGVLGVYQDVTERRRTEEALRTSEKDLKESQRIAHLGSWRLDVATNQVRWSDELYRMYGFDPALPPPPYTEHMKLFTPESWEKLSTALAHTRETGEPYELELQTVRKDGSNGWMWVRGETEKDSDGNIVGLWGAAQDITERKQAQQEYQTLFREMLDGFALHEILCDDQGRPCDYRFLAVNPAFERMTGLKAETILGKRVLEIMPGTESHWIQAYGRVALTGEPTFFSNYSKELDKWFEVSAFRPASKQFACIFTDVTKRKRTEKALKMLSLRQETLLMTVPDIIMEVDADKVYKWANRAGLEFFGNDVIGKRADHYFEGQQGTYEQVTPLFSGDENVIYVESWQRRRDGAKRLLAWWCRVLKDNEGRVTGALSSARDITEQKQAEGELKRHAGELKETNEELTRFNRAATGRELRMIELKREVNALCVQAGLPPRYETGFADPPPQGSATETGK